MNVDFSKEDNFTDSNVLYTKNGTASTIKEEYSDEHDVAFSLVAVFPDGAVGEQPSQHT